MRRGGKTTAADLLKHACALCPLPLPTVREGRREGGGVQSYSSEAPQSLRPGAQAVVSISESRGRGHPGTQASQKYTQIAEEINIPPNGASSAAPPPSIRWGSASTAVCRRGCAPSSAPEIKRTDLGHCCLHYRCTFYLLALSLADPAAEQLVSAPRRAKGGCFCVCFAGATGFAVGAVRINRRLEGRSSSRVERSWVLNT